MTIQRITADTVTGLTVSILGTRIARRHIIRSIVKLAIIGTGFGRNQNRTHHYRGERDEKWGGEMHCVCSILGGLCCAVVMDCTVDVVAFFTGRTKIKKKSFLQRIAGVLE